LTQVTTNRREKQQWFVFFLPKKETEAPCEERRRPSPSAPFQARLRVVLAVFAFVAGAFALAAAGFGLAAAAFGVALGAAAFVAGAFALVAAAFGLAAGGGAALVFVVVLVRAVAMGGSSPGAEG
jgi:hypothetical protein